MLVFILQTPSDALSLLEVLFLYLVSAMVQKVWLAIPILVLSFDSHMELWCRFYLSSCLLLNFLPVYLKLIWVYRPWHSLFFVCLFVCLFCFLSFCFFPLSGWQGSASEASVSDWCEAIDPLFEWCALISPEISCESWNKCIVTSFYLASLYSFCFCQHCLLHLTPLPFWLVLSLLENLCRFFKGVGIGVCFEGSQFILWMRYESMDVVNNAILLVRVAPSKCLPHSWS